MSLNKDVDTEDQYLDTEKRDNFSLKTPPPPQSLRLKYSFAVRGDQKIPVKTPEAVKAINSRFLKEYKQSKTTDKLIKRFKNFVGQFSSITGIPVPAQPSTVREILKGYR